MKITKDEFSSLVLSKDKIKKINNILLGEYKKRNINLLKKSNKDENINYPDLRKDLKLCILLENELKSEIVKLLPKKYLSNCSLQFPVNIRVHKNQIKKTKSYKYSTNKIHTDVWSGAPLESRNFVYYALVKKNSSYCKLYKSLKGNKIAEKYRGSYNKIPFKINKKDEIKYKIKNGTMISFDSMCPHHTYFPLKKNGIRLSLDFRVKFDNPYFYSNKQVNKKKFVISKKGQPGLGYYWAFTKKKYKTLESKVSNELIFAKSLSKKTYLLRNAYLKQKKYI